MSPLSESSDDGTRSREVVPTPARDVYAAAGTSLRLAVLLAAVAAVLSRALAPALPAVWVGVDHLITATKLAAAFGSQLAAVSLLVLLMALLVTTVVADTAAPLWLRALLVGTGAPPAVFLMAASTSRLPLRWTLVVGFGVAVLGVTLALIYARRPGLRAAALVVGALALSGLLRLLAIVTTMLALTRARAGGWGVASRTLATLSWLALVVGGALALWWLLTQPNRPGTRSWLGRAGSVAAVLSVALALMLFAQRGGHAEAQGVSLLVARAGARFTHHPLPYVPHLLRVTVESVGVATAFGVLLRAPRSAMLSAAVAAALISDGMLEMPLPAALLVVAALVLMYHPPVDTREQLSSDKRAFGGAPSKG